jgi:hypothetical protein
VAANVKARAVSGIEACRRRPARCSWSTQAWRGYAGHVWVGPGRDEEQAVRDVQCQSSEATQADVLDADDHIAMVVTQGPGGAEHRHVQPGQDVGSLIGA